MKDCVSCGIKFSPKSINQKSCNKNCSKKHRLEQRKVKDRPSQEELQKMLKTMSWCAIGREYGVSDNAVRKWLTL